MSEQLSSETFSVFCHRVFFHQLSNPNIDCGGSDCQTDHSVEIVTPELNHKLECAITHFASQSKAV